MNKLRSGCGMGGESKKPERVELKALKMWGVSVPPESSPMNAEEGRFSATNVAKVIKVAESQNGTPAGGDCGYHRWNEGSGSVLLLKCCRYQTAKNIRQHKNSQQYYSISRYKTQQYYDTNKG